MLYTCIIALCFFIVLIGLFLTLYHLKQSTKNNNTEQPKFSLQYPYAWLIQESPSLIITTAFYHFSADSQTDYGAYLNGLLVLHYTYRCLIYPFMVDWKCRNSLFSVAFAFQFSVWNGLAQCAWNSFFQPEWAEKTDTENWLNALGVLMFLLGLFTHIIADIQLVHHRRVSCSCTIPKRFLFSLVTSPQYFGECLQWIGYFLAATSPPALAFALFTICNFAPRARNIHRWHCSVEEGNRKALIPFVL
uniref:S5A_REDUCTASE domain-containing protein n=1 Tax=Caenorhabditis japonica TaxID=281687 RepID=A0A8R1HYJ4_CAEJA